MVIHKRLNSHEIGMMADILSDCFLYHENFLFLIPNQEKRKKASVHLFTMMFRVINEYGDIFVIESDNKPVGYVTCMDDQHHSISLFTVLRTKGLLHFMKFLYFTGVKNLLKYIKYMKLYQKISHDNGIHLYMTGLLEAYRGKGLIREAFEVTYKHFKEQNYSTLYLETSDKSNIIIYDKLGFIMTQKIESKDDSQTLYVFEKSL